MSGDVANAEVYDVDVDGISHGAEGVARLPDGKVCFVPFAVPGDRVRVRVVDQRRRWARAELVAVLDGAPERAEPPCPYAGPWPAAGGPTCGGCALQHVDPAAQQALKRRILVEQLQRLGGFTDPPVAEAVATGPEGYRSRARFAVTDDGRLGFHVPRGSQVRPVDRCLLLTEAAQRLRDAAGDDWGGCRSVSVHAGGSGGGLLVRPGPQPLPPLPESDVAVAVADRGAPVALRGEPTAIEHVEGLSLQVSPGSFFQAGPQAATALLAEVRAAVGPVAGRRVVDLYAGVGLFAAGLAADGAHVIAVEQHPGAVADAEANLAGTSATVVRAGVDDWLAAAAPDDVDVVVLDPPREGAGVASCHALAALAPQRVAYVSCDPAALARDAAALHAAGVALVRVVPVDCFPHTAAVEAVATFTARSGR